MKKIRAKHLILGFSGLFVLYALLGGFLGKVLAKDSTYRYLSVFQDVITLIMNSYVTPPEMEQVMDGAIHGMMDTLDTDSCYLSPEEFQAYRDADAQTKAGIGIEVTKRYYLQIVAVGPGSPADQAGLKPGDLIKSIDGGNTRELNVIVGESKLGGPAGSEVTLDVIRGRSPKPIEVKVLRRDVFTSPVTFELLEEGTGYIRIVSFRAGTDTDVKRSVEILKGQGADKIVLDVRNSFGRLAEDGAKVAELFIPGGIAARLQSRKGETTDVTLASDRVAFAGPVALHINRGSSGAAEIVASGFRSADRGELVGVPTSGRAAVQKVLSLGDGAGLVLSVGQYWTPDGKPLLGEGLEPTVEVGRSSNEDDEDDPVLEKAIDLLNAEALKKAA